MADDKIEVSKSQLDEILEQNRTILEANRKLQDALANQDDKKPTIKPKEITDRTVRIAFIDGKAVQSMKNRGTEDRPTYVYPRYNPDTKEEILFVDVFFEGDDPEKDEATTVEYLELLREAQRDECRVIDVDIQPWNENQGTTAQKELKEYVMEETGIMVPLEVHGVHKTFTVRLPNGNDMRIHENFVNI